jgi:hypothetical protein
MRHWFKPFDGLTVATIFLYVIIAALYVIWILVALLRLRL